MAHPPCSMHMHGTLCTVVLCLIQLAVPCAGGCEFYVQEPRWHCVPGDIWQRCALRSDESRHHIHAADVRSPPERGVCTNTHVWRSLWCTCIRLLDFETVQIPWVTDFPILPLLNCQHFSSFCVYNVRFAIDQHLNVRLSNVGLPYR